MKMTSKSGAALAAAAATLFLAGATMSTATYAAGEGKCVGANTWHSIPAAVKSSYSPNPWPLAS